MKALLNKLFAARPHGACPLGSRTTLESELSEARKFSVDLNQQVDDSMAIRAKYLEARRAYLAFSAACRGGDVKKMDELEAEHNILAAEHHVLADAYERNYPEAENDG